jgi:hypothetical protein
MGWDKIWAMLSQTHLVTLATWAKAYLPIFIIRTKIAKNISPQAFPLINSFPVNF